MFPGKRYFFFFLAQGKSILDSRGIFPSVLFRGKEHQFRAKSQDQKRQVQKDLQKGHVFIKHIDIISRRIPDLELIVAGAGSSASHMVYPCFRQIPVFVPGDLRPVSEIDVFKISKMLLVKSAEFLYQFRPVNRRSPAGGKYFPLFQIIFFRFSFSQSKCPAKAVIIIPGVIHLSPVMKLQHPRCPGKSVLFSFNSKIQLFQKIRFRLGIIV